MIALDATTVPVPPVTLEWILILPLAAAFRVGVIKWWRWLDGRDLLADLRPTCADVADDVAAIDAELMERLNEREGI